MTTESRVRGRVAGGAALVLALVLSAGACAPPSGPEAETAAAPTPSPLPSVEAPPAPADPAAPASPAPVEASAAPASPAPVEAAGADPAAARVALARVVSAEQPSALVTRTGSDALYLAERTGRVLLLRDGRLADPPVLDISEATRARGEQGLLGIAFSPAGDRLYVSFTDLQGDSRLDEYAMAGDVADPATRRTVLRVDQPYPNHNGGHVVFGPDGLLYLGLGDGGDAFDPQGNGQDRATLLGALLRIDPRPGPDGAPYTVPPDNPFVGDPAARPEIWAYGLRNPWRFSFDRATGDLWIGDVGQDRREEVNHLPLDASRGANFGWSVMEGTLPLDPDVPAPPGAVPPVTEYPHGEQSCSVTGGEVYRGTAIPELAGAYLYGDFCSGRVWALPLGPDGRAAPPVDLGLQVDALVSFGADEAGELYVLSLSGEVSRIVPAS